MINNNRAVESFREGDAFYYMYPTERKSYQCELAFDTLRQCLGTDKSALHLD